MGKKMLLLFALLAAGCTNQNVPLNANDVALEKRVHNRTLATTAADVARPGASPYAPGVTTAPEKFASRHTAPSPGDLRDDGCFVGLALSGGGSRSANFSAACMFQLERIGILSHVDYISSVSGGSLTAAYYCLADDKNWNPAVVQQKLTHPFASDVIIQAFLPWNQFALAFSDFDRSDLLADSFKHTLFSRNGNAMTFADLRADRPHLLINATDLQSVRGFVFCDEAFDQINSDLSKFPVSYAVAASSAVPVVMHQVTLRDYATIFEQYRHLIDGGVNDNLGIMALVETYEAQLASAAKAGLPDPYPNGAVFIVVDARTRFDAHLDNKGDTNLWQSLAAGASVTSSALLNRVSTATLSQLIVRYSPDEVTAKDLRAQIDELNTEGFIRLRDLQHHAITVVHLPLSRVAELTNLPSPGFFERLNDIATFFNISHPEAASLYEAADLLMKAKYEMHFNEIRGELEKARRERP